VTALLLFSCGLYGLLAVVLYRRLGALFAEEPEPQRWEPTVSVIIAIRNEAPHLGACLDSIAALDYPAEKLEVILIDDDSNDGSARLLQDFCRAHPRMCTLRLGHGEKSLPGKAGAAYAGIQQSSGEILFVTDADCRVPPGWIRHLLAAFTDEVGLVGGFTFLEYTPGGARFAALQALDWLYLLGIAAAAIRMNKPLSWMGNNMAFRRSAYLAVGGYPALGHSLIEDFALLDAISRTSRWRVRVTPAPEASVVSLPVATLPAFYRQRRRWALGVRQVRLFGKLLMGTSLVSRAGLLVALCCGHPAPWATVAALLVLLAGDFAICRKIARATGQGGLLRYFPAFELFYFTYGLCLPLLLPFDRRIRWKDQTYPAQQNRPVRA